MCWLGEKTYIKTRENSKIQNLNIGNKNLNLTRLMDTSLGQCGWPDGDTGQG